MTFVRPIMSLQTCKAASPALGLGTVQFGLPYGISNTLGQTPISEVRKILGSGWASGVRYLDTAQAYGSSESILGECIEPEWSYRIITKLPPLPQDLLGCQQIASWTRAQVLTSLRTLRRKSLYAVLIHNPIDALGDGAKGIFSALAECKAEGLISRYGSSIYDRSQIERILGAHSVDVLQIPINVFDQRLLQGAFLEGLRSRGIELHARSVFLQGLLLMSPEQLPEYFSPIKPLVENLRSMGKQKNISPMGMALRFVQTLPLDVILVGVNSSQQLGELLTVYNEVKHSPCSIDFSGFSVENERYVNPSLWRINNY